MPSWLPEIRTSNTKGSSTVTKITGKSGAKGFKVVITIYNSKDKTTHNEEYKILAENAPAYLKSGQWYIVLNGDKDTILTAIPDTANLIAEYYEIAHKDGEPPMPFVSPSSYESQPFWVHFTLKWRVVEGEFKDLIIDDYLTYNFRPEKYQDKRIAGLYKPGTKATDKLLQRLDALGVGEYGVIPWTGQEIPKSDGLLNVLPVIDKRARKQVDENNRKVMLNIVGGQIIKTTWSVPEDYEEENVDWGEVAESDTPNTEELPEDDELEWNEGEE
jgi:hypothetical protein